MRTQLLRFLILGVILVFFGGCNLECNLENELIEGVVKLDAKVETTICPPQDIIEWIITRYGAILILTEKGLYSEDRHSLERFIQMDGWITLEEYEAWAIEMEEASEQEEKRGGSI
ncbi:MAG: hypothetical protein KAV87_01940 [Desulfobacteraceae bacterium]|nr:hypothetical protein [Desulfobacteraceae bacterium]